MPGEERVHAVSTQTRAFWQGNSYKGVGVQPGLKLSLLVSVSQSHGLSKIDGEYGQGSPNTIEIRRVYSQGEWDPSGRLHLAVVKVGLSKQTCRVDCFYSALMAYICSCMLRRWG